MTMSVHKSLEEKTDDTSTRTQGRGRVPPADKGRGGKSTRKWVRAVDVDAPRAGRALVPHATHDEATPAGGLIDRPIQPYEEPEDMPDAPAPMSWAPDGGSSVPASRRHTVEQKDAVPRNTREKKPLRKHETRGTRATRSNERMVGQLADMSAREAGTRDAVRELKRESTEAGERTKAAVSFRNRLIAKWDDRHFDALSLSILHGADPDDMRLCDGEQRADLIELHHIVSRGIGYGGTLTPGDNRSCGGKTTSGPHHESVNEDIVQHAAVGESLYANERGTGLPVVSSTFSLLAALVCFRLMRSVSMRHRIVAALASACLGSMAARALCRFWLKTNWVWNLLEQHASRNSTVRILSSTLATLQGVASEVDVAHPVMHDNSPWWMTSLFILDRAVQSDSIYFGEQVGFRKAMLYTAMRFIHPAVLRDVRPSKMRSNTRVQDRVAVNVVDMYEPLQRSKVRLLVSPDMADQTIGALTTLGPSDMRKRNAHTITDRIANLVVHASLRPEVVRGSSVYATVLSETRDMACEYAVASHTQFDTIIKSAVPLVVAGLAVSHLIQPTFVAGSAGNKLIEGPLQAHPDAQVRAFVRLSELVFAPWVEETFKTSVAGITGLPRSVVSMGFGVGEFGLRLSTTSLPPESMVPALVMHSLVGYLETGSAVAAHMSFNAYALYSQGLIVGAQRGSAFCLASLMSISHLLNSRSDDVMLREVVNQRRDRTVAVGYRNHEVGLPPPGPHGATVTQLPGFHDIVDRRPLQRAIGPTVHGVAPPMADVYHPPTLLDGCQKRFCANPPEPVGACLRRLSRFVDNELASYEPIPLDADTSLDTWLDGTTYPEWRKQQLREAWSEMCGEVEAGHRELKCFGKVETYNKYKPARGINSRSDHFKVFCGPFFKLMESVVYSKAEYIKHIPTHLRPQYIVNFFSDNTGYLYETDYSQFEKHFTPRVMQCLELRLYKRMLLNFPHIYQEIEDTMTGTNTCHYRKFIIRIVGRRMSGEMCTSLGNGFSNLMLAKFVAHDKGGTARAIVEGDDALVMSSVKLSGADFTKLGFDIKMVSHENVLQTSFCQLRLSRDLIPLVDPRKILLKFGWSHSPLVHSSPRIRKELLRAKGLSLAYEFPQCPIAFALARRILELTEGTRPRYESSHWESASAHWVRTFSHETMAKLDKGPTDEARFEFSQLFGLTLEQQFEIEGVISKWTDGEFKHPAILGLFENEYEDCKDYYDRYCFESDAAMVL